jgi:hypothetical protein
MSREVDSSRVSSKQDSREGHEKKPSVEGQGRFHRGSGGEDGRDRPKKTLVAGKAKKTPEEGQVKKTPVEGRAKMTPERYKRRRMQ